MFEHCRSFNLLDVLLLTRALALGQGQPLFFAQSTRNMIQEQTCWYRSISRSRPVYRRGFREVLQAAGTAGARSCNGAMEIFVFRSA